MSSPQITPKFPFHSKFLVKSFETILPVSGRLKTSINFILNKSESY